MVTHSRNLPAILEYESKKKTLNLEVAHSNYRNDNTRLNDLLMKLLESMFRLILQMWPADEAEKARAEVIKAYEERKSEMKALFILPLHY
jgi:hypothetical protein